MDVFSFAELIEFLVIAALRSGGMSLDAIRKFHDAAQKRFETEHPFAQRKINRLGKKLFADLLSEDVGADYVGKPMVEEVAVGQLAFDDIVRPLFDTRMKFVHDVVDSYWPLGTDRRVVLDPARSYGKPMLSDTRLTTDMLYRMVVNGGESAEAVAQWFEISVDGVNDAVAYEAGLRKVA